MFLHFGFHPWATQPDRVCFPSPKGMEEVGRVEMEEGVAVGIAEYRARSMGVRVWMGRLRLDASSSFGYGYYGCIMYDDSKIIFMDVRCVVLRMGCHEGGESGLKESSCSHSQMSSYTCLLRCDFRSPQSFFPCQCKS